MKKFNLENFLVSLGVVIFVLVVIFLSYSGSSKPVTDQEIASCIGENSLLYVQLGCSHCETQEKMFGDYVENLNKIDCFYEREKCSEISGTPTWKIDGKLYPGVQEIETLRNLTGC